MKKSVVSLLAALLLLSLLPGCGNDSPGSFFNPVQTPIVINTEQPDFDYTTVDMVSVESTCFSEIGYDEDYEILLVRFLDSGSLYEYYDVPESVYEELLSAESPGGYYNENIKGQYECERLE